MIFTIILFTLFYMYVAGVSGKQIHALGQSKCTRKVHDWENCGHYYTGIMGGALWPVALPIAAGMKSSDSIPTPVSKEIKEQKKRDSELKAIQHNAQLEQARLMEEEMLDRRLELVAKRAEHEGRLLELEAKGVNVDKIRQDAGIN